MALLIYPWPLFWNLLPIRQESLKQLFFDSAEGFSWHPELMFEDSMMQTSFLKDLVSPVDPTNPLSFLNYLAEKGLYYAFLNTGRSTIMRYEFEDYCRWVSQKIKNRLKFGEKIQKVTPFKAGFEVVSSKRVYQTRNLAVGTGPIPNIPESFRPYLGESFFHPKMMGLRALSEEKVKGKRVLVIGGGQSGLEIFRNILSEKWGRAFDVSLVTDRSGLRPLDEAAFTNELFTPEYQRDFFELPQEVKNSVVEQQLLTSDGNTPS